MPPRSMTLLAVALLVGSVAAFTYTEKLKLERSPVASPSFTRKFSPECACPRRTAQLSFLLRRPERVDIAVVSENGELVRTLASGLERDAGRLHLAWNGKDDAGRIVPDGVYRVRVRLERERRSILIPNAVHVDTTPPTVRLLTVSETTLLVGGSGPAAAIEFQYSSSGAARPILLVDGREATRGRFRKAGPSTIAWDGAIRSKIVHRGLHEVALVVEDRAGNRSDPTIPVAILVRRAREAR